jgi:hypothetical protein
MVLPREDCGVITPNEAMRVGFTPLEMEIEGSLAVVE